MTPAEQARRKTMTNYNERLDKALERYRLFANMAYSEVEDGFRTADEFKDVALPKVLNEAKQAIISLIKELVAEARIDELSQLLDEGEGGYPDGCEAVHLHSIEDRIAQLTQSNKEQPNDQPE